MKLSTWNRAAALTLTIGFVCAATLHAQYETGRKAGAPLPPPRRSASLPIATGGSGGNQAQCGFVW